jgi:hypothetical protein
MPPLSYPLEESSGALSIGPQRRSVRSEEIDLAPYGNRTQDVKPAVYCYTDRASQVLLKA